MILFHTYYTYHVELKQLVKVRKLSSSEVYVNAYDLSELTLSQLIETVTELDTNTSSMRVLENDEVLSKEDTDKYIQFMYELLAEQEVKAVVCYE